MNKTPQPSRPKDKRPPKDKPPFPKRETLADIEARMDPRDVEAARALGTPEHLPLTPHAKSVLRALYADRQLAAA